MTERERLLRVLCAAIGGRGEAVSWGVFTPVEWGSLAKLADDQGVAPLLYWSLTLEGWPEGTPEEARRRLERAFYHSTAQNMVLMGEMGRILAALHKVSIPAIVLKGAALASTIYPDPALRPMRDLDLLVRRADLEAAEEVLLGIGYRSLIRNYLRYHIFLQGGESGEAAVELHWNLVENFERQNPQAIERLWSQVETFRMEGGREGLTLNPTAHLLYLCGHLWRQHGGGPRLLWCYDLHLLAGGGRVDWEALLAGAMDFGWEAAARGALGLAQEHFGTVLPASILEALPDGEGGGGKRSSLAAETWRGLGWRDRLGMVRELAFPSPAYMRWRYRPDPTWLWPVYYPVRWVDILWTQRSL